MTQTQPSPYNFSYPNTYHLEFLDSRPALERWWKNFASSRHAYLPPPTHIIEITTEQRITTKGKTVLYYRAIASAEHTSYIEVTIFEPGTPPPPAYFYPATETYKEVPLAPPLTEKEKAKARRTSAVSAALWELGKPQRDAEHIRYREAQAKLPVVRFN